jgi:hypothetical protein
MGKRLWGGMCRQKRGMLGQGGTFERLPTFLYENQNLERRGSCGNLVKMRSFLLGAVLIAWRRLNEHTTYLG